MIFTLILKSGPKPSPSVGEVFLKSAAMYSFLFQQLDMVICELISGVINKNAVMDAVMEDKDVMFQWAISLI